MLFGKKKQKGTPEAELRALHGKRLSYAVERDGAGEQVLGRNGGISVNRTELMSRNGVDIKGDDSLSGKRRHIVAYYSNLRQ